MPITRLLGNTSLEPEDIEVLADAFERTLRTLHLVDRADPLTELIAEKIIDVGRGDMRDPAQISKLVIKALGLPEAN
jgi:hypothetical protein